MKPRIDRTAFGSITVDGSVFEHDVIIGPDGQVKKRKKKLSKAVYGTSHTISLDEAKHVCNQGPDADRLIVGSGQYGNVELSPEAAAYVEERNFSVVLMPTPEVIDVWNETKGRAIGLFHVTC
ncbi:MAG: Mth938-like domain-containing protein [Gaiellaceae bacterium]